MLIAGACSQWICIVARQAHDNYRVLIKDDGAEIGSIGVQIEGWAWPIDTAIPMREDDARGTGSDRMSRAWDRFSADPARRFEFLEVKRKRLR